FHTDRDVVALERQLERSNQMLARARENARSPYGDIDEYRRLEREVETARRDRGGPRRIALALESLRPGDVVVARRRGGRLAVLRDDGGGGAARVFGVSGSRGLVRLGVADFDDPPQRVASIELPEPYAPRSPAFRRQVAERLRRVRVGDGHRRDQRAP